MKRFDLKNKDWLKIGRDSSYSVMRLLFGVLCGLSWLASMHYFSVVAGYPEISFMMLKLLGWMLFAWFVTLICSSLIQRKKNKELKKSD